MIQYSPYSMFPFFDDSTVQTVVNTVNCDGFMGKGLAFECKIRYPLMNESYRAQVLKHEVMVGKVSLYKDPAKWILNFPTKDSWKAPSRLDYIKMGLADFSKRYQALGIISVVFPRLGCSAGGLQWSQVKPLMEEYLNPLSDLKVVISLDDEISPFEKVVVNCFNKKRIDILSAIGLSKRQLNVIRDYLDSGAEINQLRDLLVIKGIGEVAYKKVVEKRAVFKELDKQIELTFLS